MKDCLVFDSLDKCDQLIIKSLVAWWDVSDFKTRAELLHQLGGNFVNQRLVEMHPGINPEGKEDQ